MNTLRTILTFALLVLCAGEAFPQESARSSDKPTCTFSEVYRRDGWNIPGVRKAKAKSQRATLSNIPGVFVTMLTPVDAESTLTEISCPNDHSGRIEIDELPIKILNLWRFDFGGRVFAYGLSYGKEAMQGSTRVPLGSATAVMFYDVDGSGRFTVRKYARFPFMPEVIPDWAKRVADTASNK